MENPIKMDDLGVPLFSETSIFKQPLMDRSPSFDLHCTSSTVCRCRAQQNLRFPRGFAQETSMTDPWDELVYIYRLSILRINYQLASCHLSGNQHAGKMEDIPNNHLECLKPCASGEVLPYQLVQDFFHQQ